MDFKTKKIRKEHKHAKKAINTIKEKLQKNKKEAPTRKNSNYSIHAATIGASITIILVLLFGIYWVVQSLDFSSIVFSFGKTLQTSDSGKTNILLAGIGGGTHDGSNLTDTLIIASIDHNKKVVPMLSIPRDFYIQSQQTRINSVYDYALREYGEEEGMEVLKETITEITGLEIQYYVVVDFNGFVKIVDSLEGIDLLVENAIYDPYYPKGETIYFETFTINAGQQHMDGETALKFARSRKTTSDFDRAKRQQQLLFAIKEKALSLNILSDAGKIKNLYDSIGESINTDMSLAEIIELAKMAKDFQKDNIYPLVIQDDPTECGGIVYTPAREFFSGASVLLPVGKKYEYSKYFVDTVFNNIQSIQQPHNIQVLNGTKTPGLAYQGLNILSRFCLNVVYYGNASSTDLTKSTIYYETDAEGNPPAALETVKKLIPVPTIDGIPLEYLESEKRNTSNIVVELGSDYLNIREPDPFNQLQFLAPPPSATSADEDEDTTTEDESDEETSNTTEEEADTTSSTEEIDTTKPEDPIAETPPSEIEEPLPEDN